MGLISRVSSRTYRNRKMADKTKAFRAKSIRDDSKEQLEEKLNKYRQELATLRVATVTSAGGAKVGRINETRKNIARVLTVINQTKKANLQKYYRGKKVKPVDLKPKTRAMRKGLNKHELSLKNLKTIRRERRTALKNFALKA